MVGDGAFASLDELAGFGHETVGFGEGGLIQEPLAVGTLFPFGEVAFCDQTAAKFHGHDLYDFGEGVEPGEDLFAGLAVAQTQVDLLAKVVREA